MVEYEQVEILLAEDNPADAEMCMRALRKNHIANSIHWVKDGAEALEFIYATGPYAGRNPSQRPKLLLLDLKMPKVDGIEVLRRLKGDEHMRMLPVVVMTSSNEESDIVESYRLGVNSYIVKPVDFQQFTDTVMRTGFYWVLANRVPQAGVPGKE
jgi:two-component system response regulator